MDYIATPRPLRMIIGSVVFAAALVAAAVIAPNLLSQAAAAIGIVALLADPRRSRLAGAALSAITLGTFCCAVLAALLGQYELAAVSALQFLGLTMIEGQSRFGWAEGRRAAYRPQPIRLNDRSMFRA